MKKILIISEFFGPYQNIAAIKFTKIAKYLSRNSDNKVIVYARQNGGVIDPFLERDVLEIENNGGIIKYIFAGNEYINKKGNIFHRILKEIESRISKMFLTPGGRMWRKYKKESRFFVKNAMKEFDKAENIPDVIISTYYDWGGHCFAFELKKRFPDILWIADFRDPIASNVKTGKYRKKFDEYSMSISKKADYVTVVSKGMLNNIVFDDGVEPLIATNGFDYDDYCLDDIDDDPVINDNVLNMFYAGALYEERSFEPLLNCIYELANENKVEVSNISIVYAGADSKILFEQAKKYNVSSIIKDLGVIPRNRANALTVKTDIFMVLSWNNYGDEGVLSGKFVSNLMYQKKMIAIVTGNKSNSEIKERMGKLNCGFCYEDANKEEDYPKLKEEILDIYNKKMRKQPIIQNYNLKELEKYDLKNISILYENMFS